MQHKKDVLLNMLKALEYARPTSNVQVGVRYSRFFTWFDNCVTALEAAGMHDEAESLKKAKPRDEVFGFFGSSTTSFIEASTTMKAILTGFLSKYDSEIISESLFSIEIVKGTRGYIEKVAAEANGCYQYGWYDACLVMVRRLLETLIIECFEQHKIAQKVLNKNGDYLSLDDLIDSFLKESIWQVSRGTKNNLPKLKGLGNLSAHSRRFVASRSDIDKHSEAIRIAVQELVYIADFNKQSDIQQ